MNAISFIKIMNILKKNGKYYPQDKLELKRLVSNENVYLADIDTSTVTDMSELFKYSKRVNFSGIECWDVSNVLNMADMFNGAKNFNVALDEWDLNKNINFNGMFDNTSVSFKEIFKHNKSLKKYHPQTKDELKKLVNDENIFLGRIDTSAVTDMSGLFEYSRRKDFSGIESWSVSNVENMSGMFYEATNFNSNISGWDVNNVENMRSMFSGAKNFNSDISGWDVNNVENMRSMFSGAKNFNSDISAWDVSKVEHMSDMFYFATNFNSNISGWDVSNVKDMSEMFRGAWKFNGNISNWNVSNVKDMSWMFYGASNFNSDLSNWDVSNVKNMSRMFVGAKKFNRKISGWDMSNVKDKSEMFYEAEAKAEVIDYESLSWNKMWRDLAAEGALTDTEREYVESLLKQR